MRVRSIAASFVAGVAGLLPLLLPSSAAAASPTATIVVSDSALKIGDTSVVTFTFSEAASGFTWADVTLSNGSLSGLTSSDGGITWTATLTPDAGVSDASNVITLDNTGVRDAGGNIGSGTTDSNSYAIDTLRPTAAVVVADAALGVGETSLVTFTFSEAVTGFTSADVVLSNGSLSGLASSDGGVTWTATLTPDAGLNDASNLVVLDNTGVSDAAGNIGSGTTSSNNYAIDSTRPTATVVVTDTALDVGETSLVTITFSEAVAGFDIADMIVGNGSLSGLTSSDGGVTWTATLTPDAGVDDASNLIVLDNTGVSDLAGNVGSATTSSNNYAIETRRPTATIVVSDSALKIGDTSVVTFTFSEAVSGFTSADVALSNGSLSGLASSDGGITWTATLTPTAGVSDASNVITLDNTGVRDLAGNVGSGTTDSNSYAIDTLRPTVTVVVADAALGVGETSLVTFTFSEAVTGFTSADVTVANGTLGVVASSDGGITWTATLTPTAGLNDASNVITLDNTGVSDAAGNVGSGTTSSNNYAISTTPPPVIRPTASMVVADTALRAGETSLVTITFNEPVTGFTHADLVVANGTVGEVSSSDGGTTWVTVLTPDTVTDSTNVVVLDLSGVNNFAGNAGIGTVTSNTYAIDAVRPTVTIVMAESTLAPGRTSVLTVTFSEAVAGLAAADLTVENGTTSAPASADGGTTWVAVVTPDPVTDPTNVVTLGLAGVTDLAGNAGTGTVTSNNYAIDSFAPSSVASGPKRTRSTGWTITYEVADDSAVASVALFARGPGGSAFEEIARDTAIQDGSFAVTGAAEGRYAYYTVATDTAGNVEATPRRADVSSLVDRTPPRVVSRMGRYPVRFDLSHGGSLRVRVSERSDVAFRVVDRQGDGVRGFRVHRHVTGLVSRAWNGRDATGKRVSPGRYRVVVVARDLAGNRTRLVVPIRVIH